MSPLDFARDFVGFSATALIYSSIFDPTDGFLFREYRPVAAVGRGYHQHPIAIEERSHQLFGDHRALAGPRTIDVWKPPVISSKAEARLALGLAIALAHFTLKD